MVNPEDQLPELFISRIEVETQLSKLERVSDLDLEKLLVIGMPGLFRINDNLFIYAFGNYFDRKKKDYREQMFFASAKLNKTMCSADIKK